MGLRRVSAVVLVLVAWGCLASGADAASVKLCIPSTGGANVTTPSSGTCPGGSTLRELADQADLDAAKTRVTALETLLTGVTRSIVNGRMTLQISGENLQLINGAGGTGNLNGLGNLIIGYNESPGTQSGSHNLVLGRFQTFTSWSGLLAGSSNQSTGPTQVLLGAQNRASSSYATVLGGYRNVVSSKLSSIVGGCENSAGTAQLSDGFCFNNPGQMQALLGGAENVVSGDAASLVGGLQNSASGPWSVLGGGYQNSVAGDRSVVTGGSLNTANGQFASAAGGYNNTANGQYSAIAGGIRGNTGPYAQVTGGSDNSAMTYGSAILGGGGIAITSGPNNQHFP